MKIRRARILSAAALVLGVPACGAGGDEASTSAPATSAEPTPRTPRTTTSSPTPPTSDAPPSATTEPATTSPAPDATSIAPASSSASTAPPSIDLGAASWSAVYGFGGVWIQVDPPVDQLVKVDEGSGAVTLTIDAGTGAAIAEDAVWVTVGGAETRKIDPMTGEVLLAASTPGAFYVTVGAGAVWVPSPDGISRIDPATGTLVAAIPLNSEVTDLAAADDAVWVTHKNNGTVTRIDPATNAVVTEIETGAGAHDLAIDEHGVWITNYRANTVSRIEAATNTVVATIEGVGSGVGITASAGGIFVSTKHNGISRIDPATNQASAVASLGGWTYGVAYGNGALWVTSVYEGVVYRLSADLLDTAD